MTGKKLIILFSFIFGLSLIFIIIFQAPKTEALIPVHECNFCHGMHSTKGPKLLKEIDAENTCLTCHAPGGASSLKAANHIPGTYTCLDCHDPHDNVTNWLGGTNIKLVLDYVTGQDGATRPVVFESRGIDVGDPKLHSFCDGDMDGNGVWDGVCDTCHTNTGKHVGYPVPKKHKHQQGRTCTRCHEHINGFIR
ncbi:hypothetical protein NLC26_02520 [Candidatus Aminicenantes bacterium AC-708-M15]|jgi:predicted CXXCH cytochrome family protein|nr:hypothetical protein [SCandidatus Aminicenantes bacterium Aminicenantia_JdfR_composite]MCP2598537.1 hypothetical protein [Candidatus Aminicenantes bacterium AC-335-L06]MCP2599109.1 hypothetical protein [Candidatus Aminicenantes bacterium AC-335-B20]MCP2604335.1 hypothetical protein [Candidatus Aminicenantes bacterium AC-708-M15]